MRRFRVLPLLWLFLGSWLFDGTNCVLYPREGPTRDVRKLDGVWNFKVSSMNDPVMGFTERWYKEKWSEVGLSYELMPVPASYNDIGQSVMLRDHVGWAWYQRSFYVPAAWLSSSSSNKKKKRIVLYFSSAHYNTVVFVNGQKAMEHTGGHLPFEADITKLLHNSTEPNILTVAVNNTLTPFTIPQGSTTRMGDSENGVHYANTANFDFFNYAGIHRSVFLYTTEETYISDVHVETLQADTKESSVRYNVSVSGDTRKIQCKVSVKDRQGTEVAAAHGACTGQLEIKNAKLWWPHTHSDAPGYLYTLETSIFSTDSSESKYPIDVYPVRFGIRTVRVTGNRFLLNGKEFYFTGFGKHEDSDIRGKGLDNALNVKDVNLVKWLGANSFRTSHYPYSEELMDLADELGIAVIDESPAVSLHSFSDRVLKLHLQMMSELIQRDKNRPSVFMWSVANEPHSDEPSSKGYFQRVVAHTKSLDKSRPVSAALNVDPRSDFAGQSLDMIMFNMYASWYFSAGDLQIITDSVIEMTRLWYKTQRKPVMISEYGADTVAGLHVSPSAMFSEDYQSELLIKHHRAFDTLRSGGWFVGEHIWNFADFMTAQGTTRVLGNRKGILTRQRQPKAAAKILRCRYYSLANFDITDDAFYCPAVRGKPSKHSSS